MLTVNGFLATDVHFVDGAADVLAERLDDFGLPLTYLFGLAIDRVETSMVESWSGLAGRHDAQLVVVGDDGPNDLDRMTWAAFGARLGGPVGSVLPIDAAFRSRLIALGQNHQPTDIKVASPSDAYEVYVGAGLEFLLGSKVVRYGAQRRFEAVPDGLMMPVGERVAFLYDAKAYDPDFKIALDDIRRFADYTKHFNERYAHHLGPARAFIVVSSVFGHGAKARGEQSRKLIASAGVPLAFMTSDALAAMVELLIATPWARNAIRWSEVFTGLNVTVAAVEAQIAEIQRDGVHP